MVLTAFSGLFVAIAVWHAADAAYVHAKAWLGQQLLLDAWPRSGTLSGAVKPWPWADTHPVARLVVPEHASSCWCLPARTAVRWPGDRDMWKARASPGTTAMRS